MPFYPFFHSSDSPSQRERNGQEDGRQNMTLDGIVGLAWPGYNRRPVSFTSPTQSAGFPLFSVFIFFIYSFYPFILPLSASSVAAPFMRIHIDASMYPSSLKTPPPRRGRSGGWDGVAKGTVESEE